MTGLIARPRRPWPLLGSHPELAKGGEEGVLPPSTGGPRVPAPPRRLRDPQRRQLPLRPSGPRPQDRKSTRLNSSHANISYAVFCLKKTKQLYVVNRARA